MKLQDIQLHEARYHQDPTLITIEISFNVDTLFNFVRTSLSDMVGRPTWKRMIWDKMNNEENEHQWDKAKKDLMIELLKVSEIRQLIEDDINTRVRANLDNRLGKMQIHQGLVKKINTIWNNGKYVEF